MFLYDITGWRLTFLMVTVELIVEYLLMYSSYQKLKQFTKITSINFMLISKG